MPYPREIASAKHDMLGIYPVNQNNELISKYIFNKWDELSATMKHHKATKNLICHNYSYKDGPNPALSRELEIIGFISLDILNSIRSNSKMHKSTIAVRNAGWKDSTDAKLCKHFSVLTRQCYDHNICSIILPDKYNRISILKSFDDESYACECFTMNLDDFRLAFEGKNGVEDTIDMDMENAENLWQPMQDNTSELWQPAEKAQENNTAELWQPTDQVQDNSNLWQPVEENTSNLWQPPGQEDNSGNTDLWQLPSTSEFESSTTDIFSTNDSRKRPRSPSPEPQQFHKDDAAAAADEFYSNLTRELDTRADSRLFHMRAFNGWVKATQIMELDPNTSSRALRIMDLACGKGGDLGKWVLHKRGIANYVGIDVARGSLKDAALRIQRLKSGKKTVSIPQASLICADLGEDVPSRKKDKLLTWTMNPASLREKDPQFHLLPGGGVSKTDKFDVISIQFAIHYMMKTKERARRFFKTVGDTLDLGGNMICTTIDARVVIDHIMNLGYDFWDLPPDLETVTIAVGNNACQLTFQREVIEKIFSSDDQDESTKFGLEYFFSLSEGEDHAAGVGHAVSLPEWLIPIPVLQELAEEAGLEMETCENFHEFYNNRKDPTKHFQPHIALYNMHVLNKDGSISFDNWEISRMYVALKFTKIMDCEMVLDEEDEEDDNDEMDNEVDMDDEEDVSIEIDEPQPIKVDMSKIPMGMVKAKALYGDLWNTFSADQKMELAKDELRKMAS